jgi:hypothetical protein
MPNQRVAEHPARPPPVIMLLIDRLNDSTVAQAAIVLRRKSNWTLSNASDGAKRTKHPTARNCFG